MKFIAVFYVINNARRTGCNGVDYSTPRPAVFLHIWIIPYTQSSSYGGTRYVFPERHVHEFRYTFITRAKECDVNPEVVMLWAGHESDSDVKTSKVDRGYTTYSEEYLLGEVHKIDYDL